MRHSIFINVNTLVSLLLSRIKQIWPSETPKILKDSSDPWRKSEIFEQ